MKIFLLSILLCGLFLRTSGSVDVFVDSPPDAKENPDHVCVGLGQECDPDGQAGYRSCCDRTTCCHMSRTCEEDCGGKRENPDQECVGQGKQCTPPGENGHASCCGKLNCCLYSRTCEENCLYKSNYDLSADDLKALCKVATPNNQPKERAGDCVYMKWEFCSEANKNSNRPCGFYRQTKCDDKQRGRDKREAIEEHGVESKEPVFLGFPQD